MKTEKNILIAFLLNLGFSIFEFIGGTITGSVAIASDALHDLGDSLSIGISYLLEKKSKRQPDDVYTYGYARFSVLGSLITTTILLLGSLGVIGNAICRIFHPVPIHYNGMILFAIVGVAVNFGAAWFTKDGDSLNQKAVNLHMLEDVLGWLVVLAGAILMRFTNFRLIDPLLSIGVALYILIHALKNFGRIKDLFLVKIPDNVAVPEIKEHLSHIPGIADVHHVHIWSMDGQQVCATMHIVTDRTDPALKTEIREELLEHGIVHATLELEQVGEECQDISCHVAHATSCGHHHHHHH